jgi:hypothetical protein
MGRKPPYSCVTVSKVVKLVDPTYKLTLSIHMVGKHGKIASYIWVMCVSMSRARVVDLTRIPRTCVSMELPPHLISHLSGWHLSKEEVD